MHANTASFYFEAIGVSESLNVVEFQVSEALSTLYEIRIQLCSDSPVDLEALLGQPGVLTILRPDSPNRLFHGEINSACQLESGRRLTRYEITLIPKLWYLTQRSGCRIFQDSNIKDIATRVFNNAKLTTSDYRFDLKSSYAPREYTVQYHESEFHFLSRLMEEEGLFYYFEHSLSGHKLVITDHQDSLEHIEHINPVQFHAKTGMPQSHAVIYDLEAHAKVTSNQVQFTDYNFLKPQLTLLASTASQADELSQHHHPGFFDTPGLGKQRGNTLATSLTARSECLTGSSDHHHLAVARHFSLSDHESELLNREYLIVESTVTGKQPQTFEEGASAQGSEFSVQFIAIPSTTRFKAPHNHERPLIEGIQTGVVTGPSGEEIYTDQNGRIKVQFHWDREGQLDENTTCWLRVQQASAGNEWGSLALPRVGQEVLINFIDGSPDRPLVTGAVYHSINKPPHNLPSNKTRFGIKTLSYPGGGGFNELRGEDLKGQEQLYLHAEKDVDLHVKNDEKAAIDGDSHLSVSAEYFQSTTKDSHTAIGAAQNTAVKGQSSHTVGKDNQLKVSGSKTLQAGRDIHQKAGKNLVAQAGMSISLKGGSGSISINPSGVSISGPMVKINSGGSAGSAQTPSAKAPTSPIQPEPGKPGKPLQTKSANPNQGAGINFESGKADSYKLDPPANQSQNGSYGSSNQQQINGNPNIVERFTWIKLRARYDDLWETPLVEAKVEVTVDGSPVIPEKPLQIGKGKNTHSTSQAAAESTQDEPGTVMKSGIPDGRAVATFISDISLEQAIDSQRTSIKEQLNTAYLDLLEQMTGFQSQWDAYGPASIVMSGADGLADGVSDWVEDQGDLFDARTWQELGNSISDTASNVWDYTASYARLQFNDIKETMADANELVEEAADNFFNWNWWSQQAIDAGEDFEESAVRFVDDINRELEQIAQDLGSTVEKTKKIYHYRDAIIELPQLLAEGNASRVEQFVDNVLMDIDPEIANEIKNNPDWSAVLELIADHDAILMYLSYINLFIEAIPPNFYAYLNGKGGTYLLLELLLLALCTLLSAGIATTGRIAMLSARLVSLSAKTAQASKKLDNGVVAIQALVNMLKAFTNAAKEMHDLGKKLRKARNNDVSASGPAGTTLEAKKKQEKRTKKCRVCGKANKKTPKRRRGTLDYNE